MQNNQNLDVQKIGQQTFLAGSGINGMLSGPYDNLLPLDNYQQSDINQHEHIKKLKDKFADLRDEIHQMGKDPEVFRSHQLPLARVKKIMKSDEDVRMISAEAPVLFAKACEIFIIELTHRAWLFTEEGKRRTLQKNDIAACIYNTEIFDFLIDILPKEETKNNPQIKKVSQDIFPSMNPIGPNNFMKENGLLNSLNMNQNTLLSTQFMNNVNSGIAPPPSYLQPQQQQMPQQQQQTYQTMQSQQQQQHLQQQQNFGQSFSQYPFQNQPQQGMENFFGSGMKEEPKKSYDQQGD